MGRECGLDTTLSHDDILAHRLESAVLTLTLSVRGCATPSAPLSAKNFAAENVYVSYLRMPT